MSEHIDLCRSVIVDIDCLVSFFYQCVMNASLCHIVLSVVLYVATYVVDKLESGSCRNAIYVLQSDMKSELMSTRIHAHKGKCVKYRWGLSHCVRLKCIPTNLRLISIT